MTRTEPAHDSELEERINTFLHQRGEAPLRRLRVDVCDGTAVISGRVGTYYQKQLAGLCCQRVAGVQLVVNNVTVESRPPNGELGSAATLSNTLGESDE
jgi:osmotically-inducible protein OsmY